MASSLFAAANEKTAGAFHPAVRMIRHAKRQKGSPERRSTPSHVRDTATRGSFRHSCLFSSGFRSGNQVAAEGGYWNILRADRHSRRHLQIALLPYRAKLT